MFACVCCQPSCVLAVLYSSSHFKGEASWDKSETSGLFRHVVRTSTVQSARANFLHTACTGVQITCIYFRRLGFGSILSVL